jgi:hypothetical protein
MLIEQLGKTLEPLPPQCAGWRRLDRGDLSNGSDFVECSVLHRALPDR